MAATPAYSRRPVVNEPWRFVCPDCSSVTIELLAGGNRPKGKTYILGNGGNIDARRDRQKRYLCRPCGNRKAAVVDRKTGKEVRP